MSPDRLTRLLTGLDTAADVVEAIDDLQLQWRRGWDLSSWRYDLVPWGVRFTYLDAPDRQAVEILVRLRPDGCLDRVRMPEA